MPTEEDKEGGSQEGKQEVVTAENFEAWLEKQPNEVKVLYEGHVQGLKNTVTATRAERDDFKHQLTAAIKKAEKGSEVEAQLQDALGKIEAAERKATFMEEALRPEIGCRNPRTAYALAISEELFLKTGAPDWTAIKTMAPELFQASKTKGNSGAGTGESVQTTDMNAIIRRSAGVQS